MAESKFRPRIMKNVTCNQTQLYLDPFVIRAVLYIAMVCQVVWYKIT